MTRRANGERHAPVRIGLLVVGANKDHAWCGSASLGQAFQRGPIAQLLRFRSRLTKLVAQGRHHHRCCKLRVFGGGVGFGESGYAMLKTIPDAVLGGLLLFSGIELALSSKLHEHQGGDLFLVLLMAAIGVALNPAAAFAVGLPIAYALQHEWIRI